MNPSVEKANSRRGPRTLAELFCVLPDRAGALTQQPVDAVWLMAPAVATRSPDGERAGRRGWG